MKEFVEKLIGRLEEELRPDKECFEYEDDYMYAEERHNKMLKIVNQLAEEYNNGWIPCSGCEDCQHKECEHHGKV